MSFNIISIQNSPLRTLPASFLFIPLTLSLCNTSALLLMKKVLYYFFITFSLSKLLSSNIKSISAVQVPMVQFSDLKEIHNHSLKHLIRSLQ